MNIPIAENPRDLTIDDSILRVTRAGTDALVFHYVAEFDGELRRTSPDIPFAPMEITEQTTDAQIMAHITNPPSVVATPADIAAYRWKIENGGAYVAVSSGTHLFDTTRENRSMWLAVEKRAEADSNKTQGWKTLDHGFVVLTAADILLVTDAVYAHVEKAFYAEAVLTQSPPTLANLPAAFAAIMES